MKTAVSLPDDLFAAAERLAGALKKPRSQLYAEAIAEYLARHDPDAVTEAMNTVIENVGPEFDPAWREAAAATLRDVEW